jgi:hypothetical protein
MPADRRAAPRSPEVGLRRDGVLVVRELVAGVRDQLHEHEPEVDRVPLRPLRHRLAQAVEHQPAEARVVLGEVVELRRRAELVGTFALDAAVELARAIDLEGKVDLAEQAVEVVGRLVRERRVLEPERVGRVVARRVGADDDRALRKLERVDGVLIRGRQEAGRQLVPAEGAEDADRGDAHPALDLDVVPVELRRVGDAVDDQRPLAGQHLEPVDGVLRRVGERAQLVAARVVPAEELRRRHATSCRNTSVRSSSVRRTR